MFCNTGFSKILVQQTVIAYKSSKDASEDQNKKNNNQQKVSNMIDELTVKKSIGDIILIGKRALRGCREHYPE